MHRFYLIDLQKYSQNVQCFESTQRPSKPSSLLAALDPVSIHGSLALLTIDN